MKLQIYTFTSKQCDTMAFLKWAGLQWLSSNNYFIQFVLNKPQTACNNNMDGCNKYCERDTVFLTYGSLQVLLWNIEKISGSDSCCQITDFIQYMHPRNLGGTIIIDYDISLSQLLLCKNSKFKRICGSNCSYIIENRSFIKWVTAAEIGN